MLFASRMSFLQNSFLNASFTFASELRIFVQLMKLMTLYTTISVYYIRVGGKFPWGGEEHLTR